MNKFLQIKEWVKGEQKYYYAERIGKDSVAFILRDRNTNKYGLVKEFKPPINDFLITAFGGSLDKNIPQIDLVRDEVREEAGYICCDISYIGKSFVSTQMNQFCYLYLIDVTEALKKVPEPQCELEKLSEVVWLTKEQVIRGDDWKAITILTKEGL